MYREFSVTQSKGKLNRIDLSQYIILFSSIGPPTCIQIIPFPFAVKATVWKVQEFALTIFFKKLREINTYGTKFCCKKFTQYILFARENLSHPHSVEK